MKRSNQVVLILFAYICLFYFPIRYLTYYDFANFIIFLFFGNIFFAFAIMSSKNINDSKMFWLLIILFLPLLGMVFYVLFGASFMRSTRFKNMPQYPASELEDYYGQTNFPLYFKYKLRNELDFIKLIDNLTTSPIHFKTKTEILTNGDIKFERLLEKLKEATEYIHIEYFIIHDGDIANNLSEILIEKAKAGVKVRMLFDDVGSIDLSKIYKQKLIDAGIEIEFYNPVTFRMMHDAVNYRNHRKIVVIDGKYGFTGGINIGDEYLHMDSYYGFWRDTHIMIEGDAVKSLNLIFMSDWYNITSENLFKDKYLQTYPVSENKFSGVQIIKDGPDMDGSIIKDIYFKAIMEAQENIRIATPYLILEDDILKALRVAALSGVTVDILVPGKPDRGKNLVYLATQSYFERLLEAGCNIYTYSENFMHSKFLIIDDKIASIGTANLDFRSFHLNFEVTTLLFLDKSIKHLVKDFEDDLKESDIITLEVWQNRSYYKRWFEAYAKLFSPML